MKKFFALLFANILLIHIGCVPQLGRLYAYPIYHLFTGSGYENEWFAIRCGVLLPIGRLFLSTDQVIWHLLSVWELLHGCCRQL